MWRVPFGAGDTSMLSFYGQEKRDCLREVGYVVFCIPTTPRFYFDGKEHTMWVCKALRQFLGRLMPFPSLEDALEHWGLVAAPAAVDVSFFQPQQNDEILTAAAGDE